MQFNTVNRHVIRTRRRVIDLFHTARGYVDSGNLLHYWLQARYETVRQIKQDLKEQLIIGRIRLI